MKRRGIRFSAALAGALLITLTIWPRPAGPPAEPSETRARPSRPGPAAGSTTTAPRPTSPARRAPLAAAPRRAKGGRAALPVTEPRLGLEIYLRHLLAHIRPDGTYDPKLAEELGARLASEPGWAAAGIAFLEKCPIELVPVRGLLFRAYSCAPDPAVSNMLAAWLEEREKKARAALPRTRLEKAAALFSTDPKVLRKAIHSLRGPDLRDPELIKRVQQIALNPNQDPLVRLKAFLTLSRAPGQVDFFLRAARAVREPLARAALFQALWATRERAPQVGALLLNALQDPNESVIVRRWAASGLRFYPSAAARDALLSTLLTSPDATLRRAAADALTPYRGDRHVQAAVVTALARERDPRVRAALGRLSPGP